MTANSFEDMLKRNNFEAMMKRKDQINESTDEKFIYETFKDDPEGSVRAAVVDKLSDEKLIYDTFKNDPDPFVRYRVTENLTDIDLLSKFQDDKVYEVRDTANRKIDTYHPLQAVNQLFDEKVLVNAFKRDYADVRQAVINKVTDEKLLFDNFRNDPSWVVRQALVEKLTDAEMLSTFQDDKIEDVREAAAKKLSERDNAFSDALNQLPTDQGLKL